MNTTNQIPAAGYWSEKDVCMAHGLDDPRMDTHLKYPSTTHTHTDGHN